MDENKSTLGVVKWYSDENMYGVIEEVNSEKEIFLHFKNWKDTKSINTISDSKILVFEETMQRGKLSAKNCRFFNYSIYDYQLLVQMALSLDSYLFVKGERNIEKYIFDILDEDNISSNNFFKVLSDHFKKVIDKDFFDEILKYEFLFDSELLNKFINKASLERYYSTQDINFKIQLIENNNLNLNDIDIDFVIDNLEITHEILHKLKTHPKFKLYILTIFNNLKDFKLQKEIINIAIEQNIEDINIFIDKFFIYIDEDESIEEIKKIIKKLENSENNYDISSKISDYYFNKNNKDLIYQAYKNKLINLSVSEITTNYIEFINKDEFILLFNEVEDKSKFIKAILENNQKQELLEYIIEVFEDFDMQNFHIYFEFGINSFIKLSEENQVLYLKKLFYLKTLNKLNFGLEDLFSFIDISVIKQACNNGNEIDFSTYLIIDLISKFDENDGFLATHELIKSVLNLIQFTPTKKVKIDKFFDKCNGVASLKAYSDNIISTESFTTKSGDQSFYLKVEFPYSQDIVEDIKKIPTKKYYPDKQCWGVPLRYKNELMEFGKKHNFLFRFHDRKSYYKDNEHLIKVVKNTREKPVGITYCCGQEAQTQSSIGKKFWWCNQNQCFQLDIKKHENWKEYTLFDFMSILNLNLSENSSDGNFRYEIGLYTRFVSLLNRFNNLLDRLYCECCDHVLYPIETSNFHKFSVTKFSCRNENCKNIHKEVYLNNCLNGQCNNIIDSRVSKQCSNGWYICDKCGGCCSHIVFERRLKNLQVNGGRQYDTLKELIYRKAGHLEKAEYYCYKCGQFMTEYSSILYKCKDCDIEYNHKDYTHLHKKYIHINFKTQNYPKRSDSIKDDLKQELLEEKRRLQNQGRLKGQIFGILFNKEVEIDGVSLSLKSLDDKKLTNEIFD